MESLCVCVCVCVYMCTQVWSGTVETIQMLCLLAVTYSQPTEFLLQICTRIPCCTKLGPGVNRKCIDGGHLDAAYVQGGRYLI